MLGQTSFHRPRVSRETRRLLGAAGLALLALWGLARIRYPDRPPGQSPVQPILTQLAPPVRFADLASEIGQLRTRIQPALLLLSSGDTPRRSPVVALKIRDELALALPPLSGHVQDAGGVDVDLAVDPPTGLTLIQAIGDTSRTSLVPWSPERLDEPRYLIATTPGQGTVSLQPVFVPALRPVTTPLWNGTVWEVSGRDRADAGAFVFTLDGQLVGLAIDRDSRWGIVPTDTLLVAFDRLVARGPRLPGELGVEVQSLTPALTAALGVRQGVVVSWVDPRGPAGRDLAVGDVLESVNGGTLETPEHWAALALRLEPGASLVAQVYRRGERREVTLVAAAADEAAVLGPLGLTMRAVPGVGTEVVYVARDSAPGRAGLRRGDLITMVGAARAPTPADVRRAFGASSPPSLLAVTRGTDRLVLALTK